MIVKFNDQNECTEDDIEEFIKLPFKNKLFFTVKHWNHEEKYRKILGRGYIRIKQFMHRDSILASYEPFGVSRNMSITELINRI